MSVRMYFTLAALEPQVRHAAPVPAGAHPLACRLCPARAEGGPSARSGEPRCGRCERLLGSIARAARSG
jgi:hypothetical protein